MAGNAAEAFYDSQTLTFVYKKSMIKYVCLNIRKGIADEKT